VDKHLTPALGRVPLGKFGPADVQRYLNGKLESGQSARSVQYHRAGLRTALNQALKWGLVARNVAALVDPPRVRRPEVKALDFEQALALLEAVRGDRLEALYTVALAIGLRQGEALGLHWRDVDLDDGTLTVRTTLQRIGGRLQLVEPKTDRSRRTVHLLAFAMGALRTHKVRQLEERLQDGAYWQDSGLVFTTQAGRPIAKENLRRPWARPLKDAGLPRIRFHDLPHSCASLLRAQGADARLIMEILGHSQISTTLDAYTHLFASAGQEAAARMDAALAPKPQAPSDAANS
jgi:integrase